MVRRAVWYKFTDVSEVLVASINGTAAVITDKQMQTISCGKYVSMFS
jgi:hypothetical protein